MDTITVDPVLVGKALELAEASDSSRLVVTHGDDVSLDRADEWIIIIAPQSVQKIVEGKLEIELIAPGVNILLPLQSLQGLSGISEALTFRIVPLPPGVQHDQVLQRLASSETLLAATAGALADWVSAPMLIETNVEGKLVVIRFPLPEQAWSADSGHPDRMAVYIEHSDGEIALQSGNIYLDHSGHPKGIEIKVNKFSTFTVVRLPDPIIAYMTGYEDGSFRPEKSVSRAELAIMLDRLNTSRPTSLKSTTASAEANVSLLDVNGHWAANSILHLTDEGILQGYPGGKFVPEGAVSRAEMAVTLSRWAGLQSDSSKSFFTDISGHWAEGAIAVGVEEGWLKGYEDGTYRPDDPVTRAESVVLLNRVLKRTIIPVSQLNDWIDVPNSHWAYMDIMAASR
ncbi:Cellulosome-anchoring protein precursor [compost metagenome]